MEPLESTALHLIQYGILRLLALFPDREMSPLLAREYNAQTAAEYDRVRDFLILHYNANQRCDAKLWRSCAARDITNGLHYQYEHFITYAVLVAAEPALFTNPNGKTVYL